MPRLAHKYKIQLHTLRALGQDGFLASKAGRIQVATDTTVSGLWHSAVLVMRLFSLHVAAASFPKAVCLIRVSLRRVQCAWGRRMLRSILWASFSGSAVSSTTTRVLCSALESRGA